LLTNLPRLLVTVQLLTSRAITLTLQFQVIICRILGIQSQAKVNLGGFSHIPDLPTALSGHYVGFSRSDSVVLRVDHALLSGGHGKMLFPHPNLLSLHTLTGPFRPHAQLLIRTARHRANQSPGVTSLPAPPPLSNLATSKDAAAARDWLNRFRRCLIPRAAVDLAFTRSSGPGGQVCPSPYMWLHHI
jgi:hypothetical protein